jgi:hypothetical protein
MIRHDAFLELAAAAIDFELSRAERSRLEAHLATCAACRRSAGALLADARALAALPVATLPARRADRLLATVLAPPRGAYRSLRLLAVAGLLAVVAVGSILVGAELLRRAEQDNPLVVVPTPSGSVEPSGSPVVPVSALGWQEVGTIDDAGVLGIVAFDGGYVAYGAIGDYQEPVAWLSADGTAWERVPLADMVPNCPGWGPDGDESVPDATVSGGAASDGEVLLVGARYDYSSAGCAAGGRYRAVSWVSSDGRTWRRSEPFGPTDSSSRATAAWMSPGGWQAMEETTGRIWGTSDGAGWVDLGWSAARAGASGPDGTVVVSLTGDVTPEPYPLSRGTWQGGEYGFEPIDLPATCEGQKDHLVAPRDASGSWTFATGITMCGSSDLEEWTSTELPAADATKAAPWALAATRYGPLVSVSYECRDCAPQPVPWVQYLNVEGGTWEPLGSSVRALLLADGPRGVIALGAEGVAWRLVDTRAQAAASPTPHSSAGQTSTAEATAPASETPFSSPGILAVTHGDATGSTWVELVRPDTGTVAPFSRGRDPGWVSDRLFIYTCAPQGGEPSIICTVDLTSSEPEAEAEIAQDADRPAPAPDGSLVAVHRGSTDVGETWLMRPDGMDQRRLAAGAFLQWSPDGRWLLGQPESATFEVAVVRVDGRDREPQVLAAGYDPAWSPAGDRIAYAVVSELGVELRVMSPFTNVSETRYTAPAASELTAPAWLPDGRLVYVLDGDLYRLDAGSSEPVRLTTGLAIRADWFGDALAVSPDGRSVAFSTGSGADARVGIASVDGGYQMLDLGTGPITQPQWAPASFIPVDLQFVEPG